MEEHRSRGNDRKEVRSAWDEDEDETSMSGTPSTPTSSSSSSSSSTTASPARQSSSNAVHERRIVDEGEDLSEDEVFSQVFRSRDPKELMFLALLEREFLKLLEKPLEERLKIQLKFPPMNGWYRLLIHKTAARFRMKSVSDGDGPERSATVSCIDKSKAPGLLFSDMYPTGSMKFASFLRVPDPNFKQSLNDDEDEEEDSFFSDPRVQKKKKKKRKEPKTKTGHQLYVPAHRRAQALGDAVGVSRNNNSAPSSPSSPSSPDGGTVDKKPSESPSKPPAKKKSTQKYYIPAHRRRLMGDTESESGTNETDATQESNNQVEETQGKQLEPPASPISTPSTPSTSTPTSPTSPTSPASPTSLLLVTAPTSPSSFSENETTIEKNQDKATDEESNLLFDYIAFFAHSFPQSSDTSPGSQAGDSPGVGQNVLEIYGFHPSTMTEDLEALLGLFGTQFKIKWVDDTHALAIFSTAALAERALRTLNNDPEFKLRPLSEASEVTKRCCDLTPVDLTPPAPRPATCTKVATRMILNALNVRSPSRGKK